MSGERYVNGEWHNESDANQLHDVVKFMEMLAAQKNNALSSQGLLVCAQALEPLLERLQLAETLENH
jgi:hypothetical protein